MTYLAFKSIVQKRRLLCVLLAVVIICAAFMVHAHECVETNDMKHVHHCAVDCCITCAVRSLVVCAAVFVCGKKVLRYILGCLAERRGAPPEESAGTLVQLKVKLSN